MLQPGHHFAGFATPDSHSALTLGGGRKQCAVRAKISFREKISLRRFFPVSKWFENAPAAVGVPKPGSAIITERDKRFAVRAESCQSYAARVEDGSSDRSAGLRVPDTRGVIVRGRHDELAVGTELSIVNFSLMHQ